MIVTIEQWRKALLEKQSTNIEDLYERKFSKEKREELAKAGHAMADGSFPIVTKQDLKNAIKAHGRASDPEKAKRFIKKRAKELGESDILPEEWTGKKKTNENASKINEAEVKANPDILKTIKKRDIIVDKNGQEITTLKYITLDGQIITYDEDEKKLHFERDSIVGKKEYDLYGEEITDFKQWLDKVFSIGETKVANEDAIAAETPEESVTISDYMQSRRYNRELYRRLVEKLKLIVEKYRNSKSSHQADVFPFLRMEISMSAKYQTPYIKIITSNPENDEPDPNAQFLGGVEGDVMDAIEEVGFRQTDVDEKNGDYYISFDDKE